MYVIRATVPLVPAEREAGLAAARDLARDCREHEPGTVDYRVTVDADDPNLLRFFELYRDKAAIAAHGEADHYREFKARMDAFVEGPIEATRYAVEEPTRLD